MGGSAGKNVVRAGIALAVIGCLGAAIALPAYSTLWLVGAGAMTAVTLGYIVLRGRRRPSPAPCEDSPEVSDRAHATHVTIPWRSSLFWHDFDLSVGSGRLDDWFCFHGDAGDPITVTAEAAPGGPGVFVSLYGPGDGHRPLTEALSDERGRATLTASARAKGPHHVRVRAWARTDPNDPQRYRLSIAGPFQAGRREAAPRRRGRYADVPQWHPYHDAVQRMTAAGFMSGRPIEGGLAFAPDRPLWEAEFIEVLGRYLDDRGGGADGPLRDWGESALAAGSAADPASEATRGRVIAVTVEAVQHAFPGLLAPPPSTAEGPDPPADARADRRAIADYNGLLTGIDGFTTSEGLKDPISRGEMAQLLDSLVRLVENGELWSHAHEAEARVAGSAAEPIPAWEGDTATAAEFIASATEAVDHLVTAEPSDDTTEHADTAATQALHATIAAMRRDNAARPSNQRRPPAKPAPPSPDSSNQDPTGGTLTPRGPDAARVDARRPAGRRAGRRVSRWTRHS